MANVKIRLIVDTSVDLGDRKHKIDDYCQLITNTIVDMLPEKPSKQVTGIDKGQTIEWSGIPKDPSLFDQVSIDSISYKMAKSGSGHEKNLFGVSNIVDFHGVIYGTVIAKGIYPDDYEEYTINFTVIRADGTSSSHSIDPRLRINPM